MSIFLRTALAVCTTACFASSAYAQRPNPRERIRGPGLAIRDVRNRPLVSDFEPRVATTGDQVVIRGRNLPADAVVRIGTVEIVPVRRGPTEIVFRVPPSARNGSVVLVGPSLRRPLYVGEFEARAYDWRTERQREAQVRRRRAEQAWQRRRPALGRSPAERRAWIAAREAELRQSRAQRRQRRIAEFRSRWQSAFLADPSTRAEMALHAQRMARLERMLRLAEARDRGPMVIRIEVAIDKEKQRHNWRMTALWQQFRAR